MPIVLFFSSRQISAHPIRNFRSNQSTPGRFDNIDQTKADIIILYFYMKEPIKIGILEHGMENKSKRN